VGGQPLPRLHVRVVVQGVVGHRLANDTKGTREDLGGGGTAWCQRSRLRTHTNPCMGARVRR
jgi:hypothetical protein